MSETDQTLVASLAQIPAKWWTPDPSIVAKLPRGGSGEPSSCRVCKGYHKSGAVHLDYVGHADLTRALIEIDPEWDWEPVAFDDEGLPRVYERRNQLVLWGRLTLLGKTRLCVGTCVSNKDDAEKELIGDMLRNGGMRFGVFGALWSKAAGWTDTPDEPAEAPGGADSGSQTVWQGGTRFPSTRPATPKQIGLASKLLREVVHQNQTAQFIEETVGRATAVEDLTAPEMSDLIDKLYAEKKNGRTPDGAIADGSEPF